MTAAIDHQNRQSVTLSAAAQEKLEKVFGFREVRAGQADVIEGLLAGRSCLSIFPTGGGKSLCYQLPALLLDGLTVVISPLIALMKDQLDFLTSKGVAAARLDSSLSREAYLQVFNDLNAGRTQMLYVSPERLGNERFLQLLKRLDVSLLAVDEAHCISEWGHNFRPDYLRIAALSKQLGVARVLALTATATPEVAADIAAAFSIADADIVRTGFYRPNLDLHVTLTDDASRKKELVHRLQTRPVGPAVVYVTLQRTAEQVAAYLAASKLNARAYHAGLGAEKRTEIQEEFMCSDDMVVVATIAFGMGIDKANIRAVYHYNLPKSLEGYMQEIGRAGRDGAPAHCEMLACGDDVTTLENFSYGDTPTAEAIATLVGEILGGEQRIEIALYELSHRHDVRDLVIKTLLTYLELDGILQPTGAIYTQYRFQANRTSAEILQRFDASRAQFVRDIFRHAQVGKTWMTIDVANASLALNQPRDRVVAALDYLDQHGDIRLETAGVRHGFRILRQPSDRRDLIESLVERFQHREQHDIDRIHSIIELAESSTCLTQRLLRYFGEDRPPCGHCDRCQGTGGGKLPNSLRPLTDEDREAVVNLIAEGREVLAAPRQMARFLCGVASPGQTRGKLRSHKEFARLARVPFADVLALAEEALD